MDRGVYNTASGGLAELRKLEIVNNNLANVSTPGFKRQFIISEVQPFESTLASLFSGIDPYAKLDHERTPGAMNFQAVTDFSAGAVQHTDNPLDAALRNEGDFFVVDTPTGEQYTRAGNFTISSDGTLVTQDGMAVQGDGGVLQVNGLGARIAEDGSLVVNGEAVGRLRVVHFEDTSGLERSSGARFKLLPGGAAAPESIEAEVVPSSLEMSNVSVTTSMIDLINANRGFEMYTKTARSVDEMNEQALSRLSRES